MRVGDIAIGIVVTVPGGMGILEKEIGCERSEEKLVITLWCVSGRHQNRQSSAVR